MIHKFKSSDCPDASGRKPRRGEQKWTLSFPLAGGDDYLEIEFGNKGRAAIRRMLEQEEKDDQNSASTPDMEQPVFCAKCNEPVELEQTAHHPQCACGGGTCDNYICMACYDDELGGSGT